MKKVLTTIVILLVILSLGGALGLVYFQLSDTDQELSELQGQYALSQQRVTELESTIAEQETKLVSHQEYVTELTDQLSVFSDWEVGLEASDKDSESNNASDENGDTGYQDKYPELYAQAEYDLLQNKNEKMVYLTFDDGPSSLTPEVLDLLDEYNAKATFFVVYTDEKEYTNYLSEIVDRGHTLALHSYSHDYKKIYASVDAFLADFQKVYDWVYEETGQRPTLFRFPGGSTNGKKAITDSIVEEMERRGFIYYDWNVSSGDGSTLTTTEDIIENITTTVGNHDFPVVLMHDGAGKHPTLKALPTVLSYLVEHDYTFGALDSTMTPIQYKRH